MLPPEAVPLSASPKTAVFDAPPAFAFTRFCVLLITGLGEPLTSPTIKVSFGLVSKTSYFLSPFFAPLLPFAPKLFLVDLPDSAGRTTAVFDDAEAPLLVADVLVVTAPGLTRSTGAEILGALGNVRDMLGIGMRTAGTEIVGAEIRAPCARAGSPAAVRTAPSDSTVKATAFDRT